MKRRGGFRTRVRVQLVRVQLLAMLRWREAWRAGWDEAWDSLHEADRRRACPHLSGDQTDYGGQVMCRACGTWMDDLVP